MSPGIFPVTPRSSFPQRDISLGPLGLMGMKAESILELSIQTERQQYRFVSRPGEWECCPLLAFSKTAGNITKEPVLLQYVVYCMNTAVGLL